MGDAILPAGRAPGDGAGVRRHRAPMGSSVLDHQERHNKPGSRGTADGDLQMRKERQETAWGQSPRSLEAAVVWWGGTAGAAGGGHGPVHESTGAAHPLLLSSSYLQDRPRNEVLTGIVVGRWCWERLGRASGEDACHFYDAISCATLEITLLSRLANVNTWDRQDNYLRVSPGRILVQDSRFAPGRRNHRQLLLPSPWSCLVRPHRPTQQYRTHRGRAVAFSYCRFGASAHGWGAPRQLFTCIPREQPTSSSIAVQPQPGRARRAVTSPPSFAGEGKPRRGQGWSPRGHRSALKHAYPQATAPSRHRIDAPSLFHGLGEVLVFTLHRGRDAGGGKGIASTTQAAPGRFQPILARISPEGFLQSHRHVEAGFNVKRAIRNSGDSPGFPAAPGRGWDTNPSFQQKWGLVFHPFSPMDVPVEHPSAWLCPGLSPQP
ncbi:uncharacterized protein LOC129210861 [Grus americana]|uniref:uncharacterized protein LOC129210861 n=1 Tax=Grus americana TaxID=9117 RepID=UPI002408713D|nr:uncharacterized protein LOC129210861 [Grus americana]